MALTRRRLLSDALAAGAASLVPMGCAEEANAFITPEPTQVKTSGALEETAEWLRTARRDEVPTELVTRVNQGLTAKQLYEASFLFTLRYMDQGSLNHDSLQCGAMRTLARDDVRLMAGFVIQARDRSYDNRQWVLDNIDIRSIGDPEPRAGDESVAVFADAVEARDFRRAERAAVAILRGQGRDAVLGLLWEHAISNFHDVGHTQIAVAEYTAAVDSMGWEHAEAPVRGLVRRLLNRNESKPEFGGSRDYSVVAIDAAPANWLDAPRDDEQALQFLVELRELDAEQAVDAVMGKLGLVSPECVWDALVLHAAEGLPTGTPEHGGFNVHRLTGTSAMRSGYLALDDEALKRRILLQAAAYVRVFPVRPAGATPYLLTDLAPPDAPQVGDASQIFDLIADNAAQLALAASELYALLERGPEEVERYRLALAENLLRKADNAHHFKFPHALFLEHTRVAAGLRDPLLALSAFFVIGSQWPDLPTWPATSEALGLLA